MKTSRKQLRQKRNRIYESECNINLCLEDLAEILLGKEYYNDETNNDGIPGIVDNVFMDETLGKIYVKIIEDDGYNHNVLLDVAIHSIDLTEDEADEVNAILSDCCADEYEYEEDIDVDFPKSQARLKYRAGFDDVDYADNFATGKHLHVKNIKEDVEDDRTAIEDSIVDSLKSIIAGSECYGYDGKPGEDGENGRVTDVFSKDGCLYVTVMQFDKSYIGKLADCLKYIVLTPHEMTDVEKYIKDYNELDVDGNLPKQYVDDTDDITAESYSRRSRHLKNIAQKECADRIRKERVITEGVMERRLAKRIQLKRK